MDNFKQLLKATTSSVNRVHSIPSQENKALALKMLTKLSQQVEKIQVESPKEIKKKQLAKLTKAELLAMLVDDEPKVKTSKKKSRKRKPKHDNGSLARKARVTRSANQRLDDYATKTSLAKLEMKFDDALNRRLTGVITR